MSTLPKIVEAVREFPLDHTVRIDRFPNKSQPLGNFVEIHTKTRDGKQVGDVVLHSIIDVAYFENIMNLKIGGNSPFKPKPDHKKMIGWLENQMMSLNLFGKDKNYQSLVPPGSVPLQKGTVLYANSMKQHFNFCKYSDQWSPPPPPNFKGDRCTACMQYGQHAILRGHGWRVFDPPVRREKILSNLTHVRLENLREALKKRSIAPNMEKLSELLLSGKSEEALELLKIIQEDDCYAQRDVDAIFEAIDRDASKMVQKQIDEEIAGAISRIGTFAQYCGGLHIIGLVAGDSDFAPSVHAAILNSAWSMKSSTKHGEPRVKIVVFHGGQHTVDYFLTGDALKNKSYNSPFALNQKHLDDILVGALRGHELTKDDLLAMQYQAYQRDNYDEKMSVNQ